MTRSLRVRLPVLLITFALVAAALTVLVLAPLQARNIERVGVGRAEHQVVLVQGALEAILRHGNLGDARNYLGTIMLDSTVVRAMIMDADGHVLVDPGRRAEGRDGRALLGPELATARERVLRTRSGIVRLQPGGASVQALYPVTIDGRSFGLQPTRGGLLFLEHDLHMQKTAERGFVLSAFVTFMVLMCLLTALLGLVLNVEITRPVNALLAVAQAIAGGARGARAVPTGSREFVALAGALNAVTDALGAQQLDLANRERQLRLSQEFSGTGAFQWDVETQLVSGSRRFWSQYFGGRLAAPIRLPDALALVEPEDRDSFEAALRSCVAHGAHVDLRVRCRDCAGRLRWLHLAGDAERDEDGRARRIVALVRDETEEVLARERLLATTRELEYQKYALDQHAIVAITDARGVITYVNDRFCAVSGYRREELLGKTHALLRSGQHDGEFYQSMWRTIGAGQVWRGEFENRDRDGHHYWVDTTIVPHNDGAGRVDGYIAMHTDISARVRGEREREQLLRQLHHTQKVEALGLLAGGIAHDFNNLLAAIVGHAELARLHFGALGEGRMAAYLDEITCAADRGRDLVRRLLTFSHGSSDTPQPLALAEQVEESLRLLRPLLPASIEVVARLDAPQAKVEIAPAQVQQLVMNLCLNARDAMDNAGRLEVAVSCAHRHGKCAACGQDFDDDYVVLAVTDSGRGIAAADAARIFDPFFTTKGVGEGTGLGLSVVHGVVHQAAGHIALGSGERGGARFEILLTPWREASAPAPLRLALAG